MKFSVVKKEGGTEPSLQRKGKKEEKGRLACLGLRGRKEGGINRGTNEEK